MGEPRGSPQVVVKELGLLRLVELKGLLDFLAQPDADTYHDQRDEHLRPVGLNQLNTDRNRIIRVLHDPP